MSPLWKRKRSFFLSFLVIRPFQTVQTGTSAKPANTEIVLFYKSYEAIVLSVTGEL